MTDTARDHLERAIELLDALELPSVRRDYAIVEIRHALELLAIPPREPTAAMIQTAWKEVFDHTNGSNHLFDSGVPAIWRAMYDAAIAETEGK